MFSSFATELLTAILVYIFGFVSKIIFEYLEKTLPSKKLWKLHKPSKVFIVTANTPEEIRIDANEYAITGYITEYLAADKITSCLEKLYKNIEIHLDMECTFDYRQIQNDLVVIGGPVNNPLAKKILNKVDLPYEFIGYSLVKKKDNKIFEPIINDYIETDYALITNFQNPFDKNSRVIMIAGCRTLGCYAGAKFLTEEFKIINKEIRIENNENYAFVISIDGHSYSAIGSSKLLDYEVF